MDVMVSAGVGKEDMGRCMDMAAEVGSSCCEKSVGGIATCI